MGLISRVKGDCFCAFCRSNRTIYVKKHLDAVNILFVIVFSICLVAGLWTWYDPRALGIVSLGLVSSEAFIYLRWRFSVVCTYCGFDPVLYRRSPERARDKVRAFYEAKIRDPRFLLSSSPLLEFYKKSLEVKRKNELIRAKTPAVPAPAQTPALKTPPAL